MPKKDDAARIRGLAEEKEAQAAQIRAHLGVREGAAPASLAELDRTFMVLLAGSEDKFWLLVHRVFLYAADAMRLTSQILEDRNQNLGTLRRWPSRTTQSASHKGKAPR